MSEFYKHSQARDGYLNKCKPCKRLYSKEREKRLRQDPIWLEKEKERVKEKYNRLNYKDKQVEWDSDRPWKATSTYKNLNRDLRVEKGYEAHHWNYNEGYLRDTFMIDKRSHKKLHTFLDFYEGGKYFTTSSGLPLTTKERHRSFIVGLGIEILRET